AAAARGGWERCGRHLGEADQAMDPRLLRGHDQLVGEWLEGGERDLEGLVAAAELPAQAPELGDDSRRLSHRHREAVPPVAVARRAPQRGGCGAPDDDGRMRVLDRLGLEADVGEACEASLALRL